MAVNKVVYEGEPLIDLTSDSVTEDTLLEGATAHDKSGRQISGGAVIGKGNLTIKRNGVTVGSFNANETTNKEIDITVNDLTADEKTVLSKIEFERDNGGDHVTINADDLYILGNKRVLTGADVGVATGVASLDSSGRVPSSQLPSYVDDTIEGTLSSDTVFKNASGTTITGETGKIYVDTTTNKTYRWSGSKYVEISASLALGETSSTAYRGDRGKTAYDHSQKTSGNPHKVTKSDVGLSNVANERQYSASNPPPTATGTTAGITVVYPAASCTTFSSDSGTVTPLAVQKGAKQFAITRPSASTNKAIVRYSNTTGDVQNSTIKIEDVTNSKNGEAAQVISVPAAGGTKKVVYGYCTDQTDGTSFIGGLFDASATSFPYNQGLAIGGSSGNLLWKGVKVATTTDIPSVPSVGNGTLTIKRNGTSVGTFSANQSGNASVNISVPIDTEFTNHGDLGLDAVINADEVRLADGDYLVRKSTFDNYVESQSPKAVIEGKGYIIVDKAEAPTGFTISNGTSSASTLSLRVEDDEYDSSYPNAYTMQIDADGNKITAWIDTAGDPPHINLVKQKAKYAGKYNLRFNFSQTGTISNTINRVNEVLIYVDGTIVSVYKCNSGVNVADIYNVPAGAEIMVTFWASINTSFTASDDYSVTLSNICLSCEQSLQSVPNNSTLKPSYARAVIAATSTSQTVRASYYESLNATLEKFRRAIIELGGSV
jgi:hypothetical protein